MRVHVMGFSSFSVKRSLLSVDESSLKLSNLHLMSCFDL